MRNEKPATDIVVAGTGMAGLVSAVRAQEYGGEVIVLEKGTRLGGSTLLSGRYVMTNDDTTHHDSKLATIKPLENGLAWLNEQGIEFDGEIEDEHTGSGRILDTEVFVNQMADKIEEQGGEIRLETPLEGIVTGEDRSIKGVEALNPDGDAFTIEAKKVILATGGFQGNERLVEQFITENTGNLYLRGNPGVQVTGFSRHSTSERRQRPGLQNSMDTTWLHRRRRLHRSNFLTRPSTSALGASP